MAFVRYRVKARNIYSLFLPFLTSVYVKRTSVIRGFLDATRTYKTRRTLKI